MNGLNNELNQTHKYLLIRLLYHMVKWRWKRIHYLSTLVFFTTFSLSQPFFLSHKNNSFYLYIYLLNALKASKPYNSKGSKSSWVIFYGSILDLLIERFARLFIYIKNLKQSKFLSYPSSNFLSLFYHSFYCFRKIFFLYECSHWRFKWSQYYIIEKY